MTHPATKKDNSESKEGCFKALQQHGSKIVPHLQHFCLHDTTLLLMDGLSGSLAKTLQFCSLHVIEKAIGCAWH